MPSEIKLSVRIDPNVSGHTTDMVLFDTEDAYGPFAYGTLPQFYESLVAGEALPAQLVTCRVRDVDTLLVVALFLKRDLAIHPRTTSLVYEVDFACRFGVAGLAHVDRDLARFLEFLRNRLRVVDGEVQLGQLVQRAVEWIHTYVHTGALPALPPEPPPPHVLDVGTGGFVVARSETGLLLVDWVELFRLGHLKGLVVHPVGDHSKVLAARKSAAVAFDLRAAADVLNKMESAMGWSPTWEAESTWLTGPRQGTCVELAHLVDVFVRV